MRPSDMHRMAHRGCHSCAPKGWRDVPVMSGDYDFDATIEHRNNKALPARLNLYLKRYSNAYGPITGYNGYDGYHGDD
jgi:hypothetical protein